MELTCVPFPFTYRGLPPHTRRKREAETEFGDVVGNYLRIRGEKHTIGAVNDSNQELPPHTRRKVWRIFQYGASRGTTSAYAEKSSVRCMNIRYTRNYLRIRGESTVFVARLKATLELPPHTRRKVPVFTEEHMIKRTTSAYAEKSGSRFHEPEPGWNYLRIRGEKQREVHEY
ncbi:hypothetical protein VH15_10965 [Corynebacterium ulcerans]|nr:hypothetical protein VH15_10965 [Corynebacterium ulcerans]